MEPRAGCRLPVRVEQVVNGALVVTVSCGERSFAGILLDCTKKSGLFGLSPSTLLPLADNPSVISCHGQGPEQGPGEVMQPGTGPLPPQHKDQSPEKDQPPKTAGPELPPPLVPPLPAGNLPPFPPYFEGAPFPHPLWLRNTYQQWVPQPPPRTIKRTRRRLSRNRDPGRLILSTIRLRPRQVLCEKCKSTVSPQEVSPGPLTTSKPRRRLGSGPDSEHRKPEEPEDSDSIAAAPRRSKRGKREEDRVPGERVPRSPVIKISYSTPQGKGEVVKIPSRVHGSVEPFCPQQSLQNGSQDLEVVRDVESRGGGDRPPSGHSIPKLKLTRPVPPISDLPPPKIRLKPHRLRDGEHEPLYRAELVEELNGCPQGPLSSSSALFGDSSNHGLEDLSSGSSGEDDDLKRLPQSKHGRDSLTFLVDCPGRRADCTSESVCSTDSLDELKSSGSEVTSPDTGDLSSGDSASVPSSSADTRQTVPPLTVRLHTQSVSQCVTEDGRTVAVGDIVWGKIHGFPWWPARVLDISLGQKEDGEPSWQEAKVSWFGSPTTSFLSISKLSPFSEFFKLRFNRKKKGMYRKAITEAANATQHVAPEIRELLTQFEM